MNESSSSITVDLDDDMNTALRRALIDDKTDTFVYFLKNGLDANYKLEVLPSDYTEAWEKRICGTHGYADALDIDRSDPELDEMYSLAMMERMGMDVYSSKIRIKPVQSLLIAAVRLEADNIVSELLNSHADVNAQDVHGYTSLYYAVDKKHASIVQKLVNHGAEVNTRLKSNRSLLMLSLMLQSSEITRTLVQLIFGHSYFI